MSKIDTFSWKKFKISDIASLSYGNKFDKNKMTYNNPSVNFVSRTGNNNGISDVVDKIPGINPFPAGCITLAFGGSIGSCFLQEAPFYTGQNVGIIQFPETVSREAKLFIIASLQKTCQARFVTFSDEINKHFKTDLEILLPAKEVNVPDWDYMRDRIAELERDRIAELERYLAVTGLNDYELTDEDRKVLFIKKVMRDFCVGDVLNIDSTNGIYHACNVTIEEKRTFENHPYIVRTSQNNGLRGYIKEDESTLNPGNTISFAQDTAQMFYQHEPYFTGNKVKVMSIKGQIMTESIGLFLIACLNKAFSMFGWGQSYDTGILRNVKISLPVTLTGMPDWDFMGRYIRAIEKLVVRDVVKYKDEMIQTTKKVVFSA